MNRPRLCLNRTEVSLLEAASTHFGTESRTTYANTLSLASVVLQRLPASNAVAVAGA
jgi:hypothetical protein